MFTNIELFNDSLKNKEDYIDKHYIKHSKMIITEDSHKINDLMLANSEILDNITAYKIATDSKNIEMQATILNNILTRLKVPGINFSEFASFWAVKDISYSVYDKTLKTDNLKIDFLKNIIPEYIKDRHLFYKKHGYSASTLQAIKDSKSHKVNGNSGNEKVSDILKNFDFTHFDNNDIDSFIDSDRVYIYPDKTDNKFFKKILNHYNIKFKWSDDHENKQTDFLFKIGKDIFIMEHKHMKESGGGQDKQMTEVISFISYNDVNVHYVSFLDGVYFNVIADSTSKSGKPFSQKISIINNLTNNFSNYFVNTYGFRRLIKEHLK